MMARKCYVATCSNTYEKTRNLCVIDEKSCTLTVITYHSFPKEPHLRRKWIEATGRTDWEPTNASFICSEHFRESDYETLRQIHPENDENPTQLKRVLKKTAVPTQQLGRRLKLEQLPEYSNENNVDVSSITRESSKISPSRKQGLFRSEKNLDLSIVKDEPCSPGEFHCELNNAPFVITSTVTVKEENELGDRHNGIIESSVECLGRNNIEYRNEYSPDYIRPKRQKHQDSLIAPEDIKVERCSSPFNFNLDCNLSIEEKYERLLDEFLKLRRDYDLLKFKYERQCDAISKCEQILSECR
ncbi:uncharacterized protein LOC123311200 [Coccinella septempunctata]|uniref:uncharacterized protein LOC123311200 n=1 Tax=Coccinella septempunctata TaxID=41139 RepID=UPI001D060EE0|nr:uncharacterized protein LOC123311200 [Coccinella septempunctata]